ncbi:unnamed protein product [Calypogeia fissa]
MRIRATSSAAAEETESDELEAYVKSVLPRGFAAARLWGTGRRKCVVARVVLVDGTGRIIINNRTARVCGFLFVYGGVVRYSLQGFWPLMVCCSEL